MMIRLRDKRGAVVSVDDAVAPRLLGMGWVRVKPTPAKSEQDDKPNPTRRKSSTRRESGDD